MGGADLMGFAVFGEGDEHAAVMFFHGNKLGAGVEFDAFIAENAGDDLGRFRRDFLEDHRAALDLNRRASRRG